MVRSHDHIRKTGLLCTYRETKPWKHFNLPYLTICLELEISDFIAYYKHLKHAKYDI